jgi:DNA-binding MarR family transcriptional regulator
VTRHAARVGRVSDSQPSEDELVARWVLVVQGVQTTQQRVLTEVERIGVPAQWFAVLHLLLRAPDERLPMSRLARDLSMTSGGFTKLADRMARDGLIDRRGSSGDRRVVHAALTDRGRAIGRDGVRIYAEAIRSRVLDAITTDDVRKMAEIAETLRAAHVDAADAGEFALDDRDPASPERRSRVNLPTTPAN